MDEVQKFAKALSKTKLRVFTQGDMLILKSVSRLTDTGASNLMLAVTMAQGKMFSLSQITPILKILVGAGLVQTKETVSEQTGRPMNVYTITRKGTAVLECAERIVEAVNKK